jgi:hypothetical protein
MLARTEILLDRWLDDYGAAAGILLTVLVFVGTVALVVRLIRGVAQI